MMHNQQYQPDQIYGQTDAMELTPSAASLSSSQQRNHSRTGLGDTSLAENGRAQGEHDPNRTQRNEDHTRSNDSIMNPKIMAAETAGSVDQHKATDRQRNADVENSEKTGINPRQMQPKTEQDDNIRIMESYQYPQSMTDRPQEASSVGQPSSGAGKATISLVNLQAQYTQQSQKGPAGANELQSPEQSQREMQKMTSGYFGGDRAAGTLRQHQVGQPPDQHQNFQQLDFNQMDYEEQVLDEQYRLLSQNQRLPYRLPVSRETASAMESQRQGPPSFVQPSRGHTQRGASLQDNQGGMTSGRDSRSNSNERVQTRRRRSSSPNTQTDPDNQGVVSLAVSDKNSRNSQMQASRVDSAQRTAQQNSQSQQSLLNRNTSPFNRKTSNSSSGKDGPASHRNTLAQHLRDGDMQQNKQGQDSGAQQQPRSLSLNGQESLQNQPAGLCTEENYRRLQLKIKEQAQRLVSLQNRVKASGMNEANGQNKKVQNDQEILNIQKVVQQQESQLKRQEGVIQDLQARNIEIAKGLMNQAEIQDRLHQTEGHLRRETALNEEQRAQITILKNSIEQNLERVGLRFSHGKNGQPGHKAQLSQIDGYLQLMRYAQINDQQKAQIHSLNDEMVQFEDAHRKAIEQMGRDKDAELQRMHERTQREIQSVEAGVEQVKTGKQVLQQDKEQLLDYVEQNQTKIKELESVVKDMEHKRALVGQDKDRTERQLAELQKQKEDQDELLRQAKDNLQDMRNQRENLNDEVVDLKGQLDTLVGTIETNEELLRGRHKEVTELSGQVLGHEAIQREIQEELNKTVNSKDQELLGLRGKMKTWQESLHSKDELIAKQRGHIQELKSKVVALEESKECLKKTLKESQAELINLVDVHEHLTQKQSLKSQDVLVLTAELNQLRQELVEKNQLLGDYHNRLDEKDKDLKVSHDTLAERNRIHLENERSFLHDLKQKGESQGGLSRQIKELESQLAEGSIKMDYLEKARADGQAQEKHLKKSIDMKLQAYEELNREMRNVKSQYERQSSILEQTLNNELQAKEQKELKLTQKIDRMAAEVDNLKRQKDHADKLLAERLEQIRKFENTEFVKNQGVSKWQLDCDKLESNANGGQDVLKNADQENQRLKQERILDLQQLKSCMRDQDKVMKQAKLMVDQLVKFIKQVSRVENLEKKYEHLHKLSMESDNLDDIDGGFQQAAPLLEAIQRCHTSIQGQVKKMIIEREKEHLDSSFDAQLDLIQADRIPQRESSMSSRGQSQRQLDKIDPEHQRSKIEELEQQLAIEKDIKHQFENCLQKVSHLLCLKSDFRQLTLDVYQQIKQLHQSKLENKIIASKLTHQEARYNQLLASSKNAQGQQLYKNEMVSLKQNIERDRLQVNHIDRKIEATESEIQRALAEMQRLDKTFDWSDKESEVKVTALSDQLHEMRRNLEDASSKKEWAEAKLQEMTQQMQMFQTTDHTSSMDRRSNHGSSRRRLPGMRPNTVLGSGAEDHQNRKVGDAQLSLPPTVPGSHQRTRLSLRMRNSESFTETPQNVNKITNLELGEQKSRQDEKSGIYRSLREFSRERQRLEHTDPLNNENAGQLGSGMTLGGGSIASHQNPDPRSLPADAVSQRNDFAQQSRYQGGSLPDPRMGLAYSDNDLVNENFEQARQSELSRSNYRESNIESGTNKFGNVMLIHQRQDRGPSPSGTSPNSIWRLQQAQPNGQHRAGSSERMESRQIIPERRSSGSGEYRDSITFREQNHERMPTEISVRNILAQRFSSRGNEDSARRLPEPTEPEAGMHGSQEKISASKVQSSNKYKRDLGDSVSPVTRGTPSNERLPADIHNINRPTTDAFVRQDRGTEQSAEPHRSDRIIADSVVASSLPSLPPYSAQKRGPETPINSGLGGSNLDRRSGLLPRDSLDSPNDNLSNMLDDRKRVPLRGPRSPDRSRSPAERRSLGSGSKARSRSSPSRTNGDFVMATKQNHLLPLQPNQKYYSYVQTNEDPRRSPYREGESSKIGSYVQTNKSMRERNFISNNFDPRDEMRLQDELRHRRLDAGSASRSGSRSNPRTDHYAIESPSVAARTLDHRVASDSLQTDLRKGERKSPHYQGLRQMPGATDSRTASTKYNVDQITPAQNQFENMPRMMSGESSTVQHTAGRYQEPIYRQGMTMQDLNPARDDSAGAGTANHGIPKKEERKSIGEGQSYRK